MQLITSAISIVILLRGKKRVVMDWLILLFIAIGFLFFWGVWLFAYWLPMAREAQRQFKREQARDQAQAAAKPDDRERSSASPNDRPSHFGTSR
jgi:hypothetical protein